jgi:hypothetical protein
MEVADVLCSKSSPPLIYGRRSHSNAAGVIGLAVGLRRWDDCRACTRCKEAVLLSLRRYHPCRSFRLVPRRYDPEDIYFCFGVGCKKIFWSLFSLETHFRRDHPLRYCRVLFEARIFFHPFVIVCRNGHQRLTFTRKDKFLEHLRIHHEGDPPAILWRLNDRAHCMECNTSLHTSQAEKHHLQYHAMSHVDVYQINGERLAEWVADSLFPSHLNRKRQTLGFYCADLQRQISISLRDTIEPLYCLLVQTSPRDTLVLPSPADVWNVYMDILSQRPRVYVCEDCAAFPAQENFIFTYETFIQHVRSQHRHSGLLDEHLCTSRGPCYCMACRRFLKRPRTTAGGLFPVSVVKRPRMSPRDDFSNNPR